MQGEDAVEPAELEDSSLFGERDDELEAAVARVDAAEQADDDADPTGVDEVAAGQVEDELVPPVVELLKRGGAQAGARGHVQVAHHMCDRPVPLHTDAGSDLHTSTVSPPPA